MICGSVLKYSLPFASIVPSDVDVAPWKLTIPRYDNVVSERIVLGMIRIEDVMIVPNAFGKMCLNISLPSLAPNVLAASTYS